MFIDALGWEIIKDRDFLKDLAPHRYKVGMPVWILVHCHSDHSDGRKADHTQTLEFLL